MGVERPFEDLLVRTARGWVEVGGPTHCSAGHLLRGNVSGSYTACSCTACGCSAEIRGHRTWTCMSCYATYYDPAVP